MYSAGCGRLQTRWSCQRRSWTPRPTPTATAVAGARPRLKSRSTAATTASANSAKRRLTPRKCSTRRVNSPSKAGRPASAPNRARICRWRSRPAPRPTPAARLRPCRGSHDREQMAPRAARPRLPAGRLPFPRPAHRMTRLNAWLPAQRRRARRSAPGRGESAPYPAAPAPGSSHRYGQPRAPGPRSRCPRPPNDRATCRPNPAVRHREAGFPRSNSAQIAAARRGPMPHIRSSTGKRQLCTTTSGWHRQPESSAPVVHDERLTWKPAALPARRFDAT